MDANGTTRVLVVANKAAATPQLLQSVRERALRGPARFHLLVPDPGQVSWRPSEAGHPDVSEGEQVLALEHDLTTHDLPRVREHPQDRHRGRRLAGSALAHERKRLALPEREGVSIVRIDRLIERNHARVIELDIHSQSIIEG